MRSMFLTIIFLLIVVRCANAQVGPRGAIFVSGDTGSHVGSGAFTDFWKTGLGIGLGFGYLLTPRIAIVGNFDYNYFGIDENEAAGLFQGINNIRSIEGGSLSTLYFWSGLRVSILPPKATSLVRPYVLGGVGYFRMDIDETTVFHDRGRTMMDYDPQNVLGLNLGVGTDIPMTKRADLFIEGQYVVADVNDISGISTDENMGYVLVRVGLAVKSGHR